MKTNQVIKILQEDHADHISSHINWAEEQVPYSSSPEFSGTKSIYSDPVIESLLLYVQPKIEKIYEKELAPTYSFWRTYYKDQNCPPHLDRPSCEVSVTLCIDASDKKDMWGIYIDEKEYKLNVGEGVIYKGCEQEHWRNDLSYDWHRQIFLHYIEKEGANYPKYLHDGRKTLYDNMMITE